MILARIRLEHKYNDNVTVRFHSDIEKSFLGDVYAFIEDKAWLKTTTEGYDSNGNSVVEMRNKKLNQALRGMLIDATGGGYIMRSCGMQPWIMLTIS